MWSKVIVGCGNEYAVYWSRLLLNLWMAVLRLFPSNNSAVLNAAAHFSCYFTTALCWVHCTLCISGLSSLLFTANFDINFFSWETAVNVTKRPTEASICSVWKSSSSRARTSISKASPVVQLCGHHRCSWCTGRRSGSARCFLCISKAG